MKRIKMDMEAEVHSPCDECEEDTHHDLLDYYAATGQYLCDECAYDLGLEGGIAA